MNHLPLKERCFEIIDGVMYVFKKALNEAGLSVSYFENLNSQGSDKTSLHPKNKKMLLAKFDLLSEQHQQKIKARYGNPFDFVAREPILRLLTHNDKAEQFFISHSLDNGNKLPIKRVKQYSRAADWLDLLKFIDDNRNKPIKEIGIKVDAFYDHLDALMQHEKINGMSDSYEGNCQLPAKFPTSYRNLRPKLQEYIDKGPASLIDKAFGNQAAAKVFNEECEAYLLALISDPRQFDDSLICMMYCEWAKGNKYPMITPATVGVWRRKHEAVIITGREGNTAYNERYIRQVKGMRPTAPLYLVEHDDNNLDFLFYNEETKNQYNRYVSIVVTDSYCDYVLGKSYTRLTGEMEDTMQLMTRHAYLDAMYNIKRLTGAWYLPFELKADKWALKSLKPFYDSIGNFVTPSHGNKHRGYIEQFFRSNVWKRSQKLVSEGNYNGNNITAKNTGVNKEWLDANAKFRPQIGDAAEMQIEKFFTMLRTMPDFTRENMEAPCKEKQWLDAFNALPIEKKRPITDEQFLLTFGITPAKQITINNRGIEPQINGEKYSYDLPETWMYNKFIGAKVSVVYDPFDMSRVLVTNFDDIRFVANSAVLTPRALQDHYTGSRTYLNAILTEKEMQVKEVSRSADSRKHIAIPGYYNAEAVLHSASAKKQLKNNAEQAVIEQQFNNEYENFLDTNNDFNQFFTQP